MVAKYLHIPLLYSCMLPDFLLFYSLLTEWLRSVRPSKAKNFVTSKFWTKHVVGIQKVIWLIKQNIKNVCQLFVHDTLVICHISKCIYSCFTRSGNKLPQNELRLGHRAKTTSVSHFLSKQKYCSYEICACIDFDIWSTWYSRKKNLWHKRKVQTRT